VARALQTLARNMDPKSSVLVVDDESGPRESLKMLLKPEFEVSATPRGSDALRLLQERDYEVVLLDLTMPDDLSGTETLRAIRAANIDVEAIVITGQGTLDTAVECLRLGARDYIAKPFRSNAVISAVRGAIATRAARKRAVQIREQFLGNLSHEFRTPLNAIVGYSEILHDEVGDRLTNEHRRALSRIQRNSERLLSYLEGLFFLAELDSGDLPLRPRLFDVQPWLEKLLQPIRRDAADGGIDIRARCEDDLQGYSDPETLSRLMSVLVYEATAATANALVHVAAQRAAGDEVELIVEHEPRPAAEPPPSDASPVDPAADPRMVSGEKLAGDVISRAARTLDAEIHTERLEGGRHRVRVRIAGGLAARPHPQPRAELPHAAPPR
jgi:DNA-binding response OmpR family regulator